MSLSALILLLLTLSPPLISLPFLLLLLLSSCFSFHSLLLTLLSQFLTLLLQGPLGEEGLEGPRGRKGRPGQQVSHAAALGLVVVPLTYTLGCAHRVTLV